MSQSGQTTASLFCSKLEIVCFTQFFAKLVDLRVLLIPCAAGYAKEKYCRKVQFSFISYSLAPYF